MQSELLSFANAPLSRLFAAVLCAASVAAGVVAAWTQSSPVAIGSSEIWVLLFHGLLIASTTTATTAAVSRLVVELTCRNMTLRGREETLQTRADLQEGRIYHDQLVGIEELGRRLREIGEEIYAAAESSRRPKRSGKAESGKTAKSETELEQELNNAYDIEVFEWKRGGLLRVARRHARDLLRSQRDFPKLVSEYQNLAFVERPLIWGLVCSVVIGLALAGTVPVAGLEFPLHVLTGVSVSALLGLLGGFAFGHEFRRNVERAKRMMFQYIERAQASLQSMHDYTLDQSREDDAQAEPGQTGSKQPPSADS